MIINYRPEIDGVRGIAVVAVIFYHAQITIFGHQPFQGGFIGVDIFFVISGYLITSIILKELVTTGKFSFKHFYERRIRRILPALLFVILVSLPFAWMYLLPTNFIDFSKSILYSLGFNSNWYFHISGQKYWEVSSLLKPFLHTWSLSIEEQYYVLFPIVLLMTFKYFRKYLGVILIISFFISLITADWLSRNHPSFNFYALPSRGWELIAGSGLAYFEIQLSHRSKYQTLNLILPSVGLFLIGHSILFFNDRMFLPSFYTLSPIIGVCLIIWFSHKDELITKILSSKLFVGIGLISYSLYLWHYPIFAFARITEFTQGDIFKKVLLGSVLVLVSIISYFFIERPARNKKYKFNKIILALISLIVIIVIVNSNIILKDGFKKRFFVSNKYELANLTYLKQFVEFEKNYNYDDYDLRENVLIIGNSHGEDLLKILSFTNLTDKIYFNIASLKTREDDYSFQLKYLLKLLKENKAVIDFFHYFKSYNDKDLLAHLKKQYTNAKLIIFSTKYTDNDLIILDELIQLLKKDNKEIIIFDNTLEMTDQTGHKLNRSDAFVYKNKRLPNINELKKIEQNMFEDLNNTKDTNLKIEEIAKRNGVNLIQRKKIHCNFNNKRCPALTDDGYKIYFDYAHITYKGAEFFARRIEKNDLFLKYLNSTLDIPFN